MYASQTFPLRSNVTKSLTPNVTTTLAKRHSHVKNVIGTRRFSKTITEYYEEDTQRSTASGKSSYPKPYDHVSLSTRNSQTTRVRLVCIVTYAQRIAGLKWQPMSIIPYERVTHALRTALSSENERMHCDYSPHEAHSKRYRSKYSAHLRKRRKDIDSYLSSPTDLRN